MDYWHKAWQCPFFAWDDACRVFCEGKCAVVFPDKTAAKEYHGLYCASESGWKECSLARSKLAYYDRKHREEQRTRPARARVGNVRAGKRAIVSPREK